MTKSSLVKRPMALVLKKKINPVLKPGFSEYYLKIHHIESVRHKPLNGTHHHARSMIWEQDHSMQVNCMHSIVMWRKMHTVNLYYNVQMYDELYSLHMHRHFGTKFQSAQHLNQCCFLYRYKVMAHRWLSRIHQHV